jgi:CheY-like chemotaxis protein
LLLVLLRDNVHIWRRTIAAGIGRSGHFKKLAKTLLGLEVQKYLEIHAQSLSLSVENMKAVLLVEDNEDDALMMKMACQRTGIPHTLNTVADGEAAINYLLGAGVYGDRSAYPLPNLVFLDIKLPKRNGHEVLEWIRGRLEFKSLPIVMLTSSSEPKDVSRAYSLGVTSYLRKMGGPAEFGQAVRVILKYWLELNVTSA